MKRERGWIHGRRALAGAVVAAGALSLAESPGDSGAIRLLAIDGVVSPFTSRYLVRELEAAARAGDRLVVVQLDTPGGLLESTREMTSAMLASPVPIAVHVAPPGARAASAGVFLLLASHVAAMAPGTHVGAAHPVRAGGGSDAVLDEKVVSDASAMARAIAAERGRDEAWAERAVRESVSATADEALALGIADVGAADLEQLLAAIDGRTVRTRAGERRIETRGAPRLTSPMRPIERLLQAFVHPDVAYVLFTIGLLGLAAELATPGVGLAGLAGVVSLLLAFTAFGALPVSWAGIAFLVLGVGLVVADLLVAGVGPVSILGAVAFLAGSLVLYEPADPAAPAHADLRVSGWIIAAMAVFIGGFVAAVARALVRTRRARVVTGTQALVSRTGIARTALGPDGIVEIDRERWSATAAHGPIAPGEEVRVLGVEGVRLKVERAAPPPQ